MQDYPLCSRVAQKGTGKKKKIFQLKTYPQTHSLSDYKEVADTYLKLEHTMYTVCHVKVSQLSLQGIPMSPRTFVALQYAKETDKSKIADLILADCHDFLWHQKALGLTSFLGSSMFRGLQSLNLENMGLTVVPDFTRLGYLVELNLNENKISSLKEFHHKNLRSLAIAGNPIKNVDVDVEYKVPNLESIAVGSAETKFIGASVLNKAARPGGLEVKIVEHGDKLLIPQKEVIHWTNGSPPKSSNTSRQLSSKRVLKVASHKPVFEYIRQKRETTYLDPNLKGATGRDIAKGYELIINEVNTTKQIHTLEFHRSCRHVLGTEERRPERHDEKRTACHSQEIVHRQMRYQRPARFVPS